MLERRSLGRERAEQLVPCNIVGFESLERVVVRKPGGGTQALAGAQMREGEREEVETKGDETRSQHREENCCAHAKVLPNFGEQLCPGGGPTVRISSGGMAG